MDRVALDTNLLVLLCIGQVRPDIIESHSRTRRYRRADYVQLVKEVAGANEFLATPCVFAEVSNLLDRDPRWQSLFLPSLTAIAERTVEVFEATRSVLATQPAGWLGVTDAMWLMCLDQRTLLLSSDRMLVQSVLRVGKAARLFPV
jgi:hypothetical protein